MIDLYLGGDKSIFLSRIVAKNEIFSLEILQQLSIGAMPSFLAFSRNRPLALAIAESGETLCSMRMQSGGVLEVISQVPCPGGPAYVAFDSHEAHALTASYGSGHTRLYSISGDGSLLQLNERHTGKHTHCAITSPDGGTIFSPSKGTDTIARARLREGALVEHLLPIVTPQGSGPRHLVFSRDKKRAYLACENDCSLIVYEAAGEELRQMVHLAILPQGKTSADSGADVHVSADDKYIYVSNRGQDSVSCFRRTDSGATLVSVEKARCLVPRNFCLLDPDWLIVAGQESHSLALFRRDLATGALLFVATVNTPERPFWVGNSVSY